MTKSEAAAMLAIAGLAYSKPIDPAAAEVWASMLADVSSEDGASALRSHMANSQFFPTIADIRKRVALRRSPPMDAGSAWGEVQRSVSSQGRYRNPTWSHPAIAHAVNSIGWIAICDCDVDNLNTLRAQFERYLKSAVENQQDAANVGQLEAHQRGGSLSAGEAMRALTGGAK